MILFWILQICEVCLHADVLGAHPFHWFLEIWYGRLIFFSFLFFSSNVDTLHFKCQMCDLIFEPLNILISSPLICHEIKLSLNLKKKKRERERSLNGVLLLLLFIPEQLCPVSCGSSSTNMNIWSNLPINKAPCWFFMFAASSVYQSELRSKSYIVETASL